MWLDLSAVLFSGNIFYFYYYYFFFCVCVCVCVKRKKLCNYLSFFFFFFLSFSSVFLDWLAKVFLRMFYGLLCRRRVTSMGQVLLDSRKNIWIKNVPIIWNFVYVSIRCAFKKIAIVKLNEYVESTIKNIIVCATTITITTKLGWVVTYREQFSHIKSHEPLIKCSERSRDTY